MAAPGPTGGPDSTTTTICGSEPRAFLPDPDILRGPCPPAAGSGFFDGGLTRPLDSRRDRRTRLLGIHGGDPRRSRYALIRSARGNRGSLGDSGHPVARRAVGGGARTADPAVPQRVVARRCRRLHGPPRRDRASREPAFDAEGDAREQRRPARPQADRADRPARPTHADPGRDDPGAEAPARRARRAPRRRRVHLPARDRRPQHGALVPAAPRRRAAGRIRLPARAVQGARRRSGGRRSPTSTGPVR